MENILAQINNLGAFQLNLLSSAVFGFLIFITHVALKRLKKSGIAYINSYAESYLYKYIAHRNIYESEEISQPIKFFFHVCLMGIMWLLFGLLILVFFYGVKAFSSGDWFTFLGHWFAFNSFFEGYMWVRDSRNDETAKALYKARYESTPTEKSIDK